WIRERLRPCWARRFVRGRWPELQFAGHDFGKRARLVPGRGWALLGALELEPWRIDAAGVRSAGIRNRVPRRVRRGWSAPRAARPWVSIGRSARRRLGSLTRASGNLFRSPASRWHVDRPIGSGIEVRLGLGVALVRPRVVAPRPEALIRGEEFARDRP